MGVVLLALFLVLRILKERTWKEMESKKEKRKGKEKEHVQLDV